MDEPIIVTIERAGDNYGFDQHGRALITWRTIGDETDHCLICAARINAGWAVFERRVYQGHVCDAHVQVRRPA